MGFTMPLVIRLKARFRTKEILVSTLTGMAFLFVVMGNTILNHYWSLFLISFLRMVGMMEVILPLMFILSADGNRGRFYAVFIQEFWDHPGFLLLCSFFVDGVQPGSTLILLIAAVCLATALICVVFQHNQRFMKKCRYITSIG